ncbi:MAG: CobW family GTP-binding protein, partial [Spirosomataceae bacterium]
MAIPVTIITGFLGAGKTTFLNALLAHLSTQKLAIIENEFGKENIDSELIIGNTEKVMTLTQGCICCTLNEDFYTLLNEIHKKDKELNGLIIETTGIADPSGILTPFLITPALRGAFPVARVICLVDASLITQQLQETEEAITQISYSNHILLVKTDVVSPAVVKELQQMLAEINPTAHIWTG